jgi:hypothetical protein
MGFQDLITKRRKQAGIVEDLREKMSWQLWLKDVLLQQSKKRLSSLSSLSPLSPGRYSFLYRACERGRIPRHVEQAWRLDVSSIDQAQRDNLSGLRTDRHWAELALCSAHNNPPWTTTPTFMTPCTANVLIGTLRGIRTRYLPIRSHCHCWGNRDR